MKKWTCPCALILFFRCVFFGLEKNKKGNERKTKQKYANGQVHVFPFLFSVFLLVPFFSLVFPFVFLDCADLLFGVSFLFASFSVFFKFVDS